MKFDFAIIKKHPYGSGAAILGGGILVWYLFLRSPSSAASSNAPVDQSNTPAGLQAQQIAGQLSAMQEQDQTQIALATLASQTKLQEDAYNYSLGQGQLTLQGQQIQSQQQIALAELDTQLKEQEAGYAAAITEQHNQIQGNIAMATVNANLQRDLAATSAQLQNNLAQYQMQAYEANLINTQVINGQNVNLQETAINANENLEENKVWAQAIGSIAMAFL